MKKVKKQKPSLKNHIFSFGVTSWVISGPLCKDIGFGDFRNSTVVKFEIVIFYIVTILGLLANLYSIFMNKELKWLQKGFAFLVVLFQISLIFLINTILKS